MHVRVKICGITRAEDAWAAAEAGADALGFMFYKNSPRCLDRSAAADIIRILPPFIAKVGVFVDAPAAEIRAAAEQCGLDMVQLHGQESPEFCRQLPWPVLKAFRMENVETLELIPLFQTAGWLLDSFVPGVLGGSGARFNWDLALEAKKLGGRVILAGGLNPENVAEAVARVQPYAVDVSSGVEISPGKKDPAKIRDFILAAKAVGNKL